MFISESEKNRCQGEVGGGEVLKKKKFFCQEFIIWDFDLKFHSDSIC